MSLKIMYARDLRYGIGFHGDLPWARLPADMRHFRNTTKGATVIMGRLTYESLPDDYRPLPDRTNIVLSRQSGYAPPGALVCYSLQEAMASHADEDLFVIGGASVYREAMPLAEVAYETIVQSVFRADVTIDPIDSAWSLASTVIRRADEPNPYELHFNTYLKPPTWLAAAKGE